MCSEEGNCKLIFISILEENLNSLHGNDPRHPRESITGFNCSQSWPIRVGQPAWPLSPSASSSLELYISLSLSVLVSDSFILSFPLCVSSLLSLCVCVLVALFPASSGLRRDPPGLTSLPGTGWSAASSFNLSLALSCSFKGGS